MMSGNPLSFMKKWWTVDTQWNQVTIHLTADHARYFLWFLRSNNVGWEFGCLQHRFHNSHFIEL